jgi:cephalosporin hydroxylase
MGKTIDQIIRENFTKDFRTGTPYDDTDSPERFPLPDKWDGREFSACNAAVLSRLIFENDPKNIVEIGVARIQTSMYEHTSTSVFVSEKSVKANYFGIDIADRSFVQTYGLNVFTIQADSADTKTCLAAMKQVGIKHIDLLMIDGWHSINTVIQEFAYTDLIPVGGVVVLHDVNLHPGPKNAVQYANPEKWKVEKYCPDDWGIAVLTKLKA